MVLVALVAQALGLAEAGADVIVASRQLENLEPVAKEIQARGRLTGRH